MQLSTMDYIEQTKLWPSSRRHILAHYDEQSIVVYQAYRPEIGEYAVKHQRLGGEFSLNRMSWIKPNFLWMMYRSGWGTKPGQEVILAIWLSIESFESILEEAVHASFVEEVYSNREDWSSAVKNSDVRLQWDPDHLPKGAKLERRAIQLGLRGKFLKRYAHEWIHRIEDVSEFVAEQRNNLSSPDQLVTPVERVYAIKDPEISQRVGVSNLPDELSVDD